MFNIQSIKRLTNKQSTESDSEMTWMLELSDREFKIDMINT